MSFDELDGGVARWEHIAYADARLGVYGWNTAANLEAHHPREASPQRSEVCGGGGGVGGIIM